MKISFDSTIAILGGAGKAGRPLVWEALRAGYRVRVLLRHPEQFDLTDARLQLIQGDARDPAALRQLLGGCSALLSTLGNPRGEPMPMLSTVTGHLLLLLPEAGIRQYVTVTSLYKTGSEQQDLPTKQAAEFMDQTFPQFMADRRRELELLSASDLDWTYVRLPYVMQEPALGTILVNLEHLPGPRITAEDLARFLVGQLESREYVSKAPFVANG
ncbi:MAG: NAD(P)H-binding protein [Sphingobacteriaceae bacterium]|nr:NAD(P)H-binding protein [Cytophagaceae bacterium]